MKRRSLFAGLAALFGCATAARAAPAAASAQPLMLTWGPESVIRVQRADVFEFDGCPLASERRRHLRFRWEASVGGGA